MLYGETRPATLIRYFLGGSGVIILGLAFFLPFAPMIRGVLGACALLELLLAFAFHSLSIELNRTELSLSFGPGWFHRRYTIEKIASARLRDWAWWRGAGVRVGVKRSQYIVGAGDVVEIQLQSGWKIFLGCLDGRKLLAGLVELGVPSIGEESD